MQELLELRREKKLRDEELHILRASQNECASMARDIELLQACVEQQRQHLVDVQKNREKPDLERLGPIINWCPNDIDYWKSEYKKILEYYYKNNKNITYNDNQKFFKL